MQAFKRWWPRTALLALLVVIFGLFYFAIHAAQPSPSINFGKTTSGDTGQQYGPEESIWHPGTWPPVTTFTFFLTLATCGLLIYTARLWDATKKSLAESKKTGEAAINASAKAADAAMKSAQTARQQLQLAYPVKFRVQSIVAWDKNDQEIGSFYKRMKIHGYIDVINVGHARAKIDDKRCTPFWHVGNLPMTRPNISDPTQIDETNWESYLGNGDPGSVSRIKFTTTVPDNYTPEMHFYTIGSLRYSDGCVSNLYILFARRFEQSLGRFVRIDNPDYDTED